MSERELPNGTDSVDVGYRSWDRELNPVSMSWWPITRTSFLLIIRRRVFWILFIAAIIPFLFVFARIYIESSVAVTQAVMERRMAEAEAAAAADAGERSPQPPRRRSRRFSMVSSAEDVGRLFFDFMQTQGRICALILAFGGIVLVGGDFRDGGLIFYLSKRVSTTHYLIGKFFGIAALVTVITTIPALILFFQYEMMKVTGDAFENLQPMIGILGYGLTMTVVLSCLSLAIGSVFHKTIPLVMTWAILLVILPVVTEMFRQANFDRSWLLINLWRDIELVGRSFFDLLSEKNKLQLIPAIVICVVICVVSLVVAVSRLRNVRVVS